RRGRRLWQRLARWRERQLLARPPYLGNPGVGQRVRRFLLERSLEEMERLVQMGRVQPIPVFTSPEICFIRLRIDARRSLQPFLRPRQKSEGERMRNRGSDVVLNRHDTGEITIDAVRPELGFVAHSN